ncbi:thioredoxin [Hokovirus HKV1]|uniref:Thioredoxin n=1 Tax=Hokovirus HKV1 TaxID=1977638 RepID=A0A1V0SFD8_9VIRU|nr:thioredoxin [Hokovirus HKV1]
MFKLIETIEEFKDIILNNSKQYICINIGSSHCHTCELFLPNFESVSNMDKYNNIAFYKVNFDQVNLYDYNIKKFPTIMLFDKGNLISHYSQNICYDISTEKLEEYLGILYEDLCD